MFNFRWIRKLALIIVIAGLLGISRQPAAASSSLNVAVSCFAWGNASLICQSYVNGGTGTYSYTWAPTQIIGEETALIPCEAAYRDQSVFLTVTDSNGATGSGSTTAYCGDAV